MTMQLYVSKEFKVVTYKLQQTSNKMKLSFFEADMPLLLTAAPAAPGRPLSPGRPRGPYDRRFSWSVYHN